MHGGGDGQISQRQTRWDRRAKCEERREEWRDILCAEASRARLIALFAKSARSLDAETLVSGTLVRPLTISSGPLPVRRAKTNQPGSRRVGLAIVQHAVPSYPPSILSAFQEEEGREWEEAMVRLQAPARRQRASAGVQPMNENIRSLNWKIHKDTRLVPLLRPALFW